MTDTVVTLRLAADGSMLSSASQKASRDVAGIGSAASSAGAKTEAGFRRAAASAESLSSAVDGVKRQLAGLVAFTGLAAVTASIVSTTNAMAGFESGLKAVLGTQRAAAEEMAFVRREAGRLGLDLQVSAQAYTQLAAASRGTSLEGAQTRRIFTGVSEAARVLHLTSEQTSGALNAIQQMMSKGNVQAEELRGQLGERLPGAFNLAAQAMGVTTSQLNKMLDDGKVLAADLLPRLADQLHKVYGAQSVAASNLPAAQFARLRNSITELQAAIGNAGFLAVLAAGAVAVTQALTSLVQSGAIDTIVAGLGAIATVAASAFGGRVLSAIGAYIAGLTAAAKEQAISIGLDREFAASKLAAAQARSAEIARTLEVVAAARQEATAKLAVAAADVEAARAHLAAAEAAGVQSYALRQQQVATESLTAAKARQAALTTELASLGAAQAALQSRLAGAATEQIAAQQRVNSAMTLGGAAVGALTTAGRGLLALLGGWPGVVLAAGAALLYFANQADDASKAAERASGATQALRSAREEGIASAVTSAEQEYKLAQETLRGEEAKLKAIASQTTWSDRLAATVGIMTTANVAYAEQYSRVIELSQSYGALGQALDDARRRQIAFNVAQSFDEQLQNAARAGLDRANAAKAVVDSIKKEREELEKKVATFGKGAVAEAEYEKSKRLAALATQADTAATRAQREAIEREYATLLTSAKAYDALTASKKGATTAAKEQHAAERLAEQQARERERQVEQETAAQERLGDILDRQSEGLRGPVAQALKAHQSRLAEIGKVSKVLLDQGPPTIEVHEQIAEALTGEAKAYDIARAAAERQEDVAGRTLEALDQEIQLLGLSSQARRVEEEVIRAVNEAKSMGAEMAPEAIAQLRADVAARQQVIDALGRQRDATEEANRTLAEGLGRLADLGAAFVTRQIKSFKDLRRSVVDTFRQMVTDLIAQWLRTRVIGWITGSGGGLGGLAAGIAGAVGLGGAGSASGSTGSSAGDMATSLAQSGAQRYLTSSSGFDLFSPSTWMQAGRNLWNGFTQGSTAAGGTMFGTWSGTGSVYSSSSLGYGGVNLPFGGTGAYTPTPFGYAAGAVGGLYAGYNRFQNTEGGLAGFAGGAAYGIGTAGLIGGLGSLAAGGTFGAGLAGGLGAGAAAGAGMTGLAAAIPVIGWAALIAMVVDMVSGGKLFGTKFRPESSTVSLGLSEEGGTASASVREVRQQSLFRGRKWRTSDVEPTAEAQKAADQLFKSIQQTMAASARALAIDTPPMIDAALTVVTDYDKKGKVKATKYFVDALGRTWEESSQELAATRLSAEAIVATVAASEAGHAASTIAERWRDSAEQLMAGAQFLVAATADISRGSGLLEHGAGPDASEGATDQLSQIADLVEELAVGEEALSQTYARLKADTDNLQLALDLMGQSLDRSGAEFVRFAVGIEQAAGGLDAANSLWSGFFQSFYSQSELATKQAELLRQQSDTALAAIGVSSTVSMEEFRKQFEEALPTLSPEDVVSWLKAGNALAAATKAADDLAAAQAEQVAQAQAVLASMGLAERGLSQFGQAIVAIKAQEKQAEDAANAIAKAQGREGASTRQLAAIHDWAEKQIAAAMRRLAAETQDIKAKLYGGLPGTLDGINARISELEDAANQAAGGVANGIRDVTDAGNDLVEQWRGGIKSLRDYLDSSLFGDISTLTPEQQVAEARRQLDATIDAATRGDADALARLPQMMDQFGRLWTGSQASGADRNGVLDNYRAQLVALLGLQGPNANPTPGSNNTGGGTVSIVPSPELQALYAQRDALLADQEREFRAGLAQQLAQNLHDMAVLTRTPILDMIQLQGVALDKLAADMGVDLNNLTAESVLALGNMATTLGLSLTDLTGALGINLTDLAGGVTALTSRLGIDLSNLTTSSTQTLADLANSLGGDLTDLAESVGVDLGDLTDKQSLLNQALGDTIDELPQAQRDQLQPLLEAISDATTEADANAAIKALEDAVNETGGATATALAPYLKGVFPPDALTDLDYLEDLQDIAASQLNVLKAIARGLEVPGYAVGSARIMGDQLARLHDGEIVIDPQTSNALRTYGIRVSGGGGSADLSPLVAEVRALRAEVAELRAANDVGHRRTAETVMSGDQTAQRQRDDQRRALEDTARSRLYG